MMRGSLAEKLLLLRAQRGLTLVQASQKTGVDRGTLSSLERGVHAPYAPTLSRIARGYGVPVEELLGEPVPLGEAPPSGQAVAPESVNPGDDQPVHLVDIFRRIKVAGDRARQVAPELRREAERSLEEGRDLTENRVLQMYSFHNELSRLYADSLEAVLEGARRGVIVTADAEGVNRYLGPEPERWPRELKQPLYEAGARISALHGLIEKIELEASERRQETAEWALYEEFNVEDVEDRLPAAVLRDPEWREELDKALAGVA